VLISFLLAARWPVEPVVFQFDSPDKSVSLVQGQVGGTLSCSLLNEPSGTAKWTLAKPLPSKPYRVLFAANGSLVLIQTWGSDETDQVLGFIDSTGKVGKSYSEKQLFPKLDQFQPETFPSSHWWEDNPDFLFSPDGANMVLYTEGGTVINFDTSTGEEPAVVGFPVMTRIEQTIQPLFTSGDPRDRSHALRVAGAFKMLDFLPAAKRLLDDPFQIDTRDADHDGGDMTAHLCYPVQLAAGVALVGMLGEKALPLLESKAQSVGDSTENGRWGQLLKDKRLQPPPKPG